tara:strand:- start:121 stop:339 length:219 start_codon:yes stop_codon:yes gene_type:complete
MEEIDTILIDGRFRVACALSIFPYINENTLVLLDDFINRQNQFSEVLKYYEIVKSVNNPSTIAGKEECKSSR